MRCWLKHDAWLLVLAFLLGSLLTLSVALELAGETHTRRVLFNRFVPVDVGEAWQRELDIRGLSPFYIPLCVDIDHLPDQAAGVVGTWIPCLE